MVWCSDRTSEEAIAQGKVVGAESKKLGLLDMQSDGNGHA